MKGHIEYSGRPLCRTYFKDFYDYEENINNISKYITEMFIPTNSIICFEGLQTIITVVSEVVKFDIKLTGFIQYGSD